MKMAMEGAMEGAMERAYVSKARQYEMMGRAQGRSVTKGTLREERLI